MRAFKSTVPSFEIGEFFSSSNVKSFEMTLREVLDCEQNLIFPHGFPRLEDGDVRGILFGASFRHVQDNGENWKIFLSTYKGDDAMFYVSDLDESLFAAFFQISSTYLDEFIKRNGGLHL